MKNFYFILILSSIMLNSCKFADDQTYLGQSSPGEAPEIFAPGIISTGMYERDITISPQGDEFYYSLFLGDWNTIMMSKKINGRWTEPVVATFARDTNYFFAEPALSADGKKIFFLSTKPRETEQTKPGWSNQNIWIAERNGDGPWDEAKPLPENINLLEEFYPSLTDNGTLYFCRTNESSGISSIYRSKLVDQVYQEPEILPQPINGSGTIFNAWISPDESYLLGCVAGRDSLVPKNVAHYYIYFRSKDDRWSEGIDITSKLNLPCPNAISISLSPDSKYLFFASTKKIIQFNDLAPSWSQNLLAKRRSQFGNGNSDIYWMKIDGLINNLKETAKFIH